MLRLAHSLGRTLAEIGELDLDELALWIAWYAQDDPALREDLRTGVLASTIANCALFGRGGFKPEDFMPSLRQSRKPADDRDMERQMTAWCANVGGQVKVQKRSTP